MRRFAGRCSRLVALVSGAVLVVTILFATPAWAHVTVHPESMPAGSGDIELTFRVPSSSFLTPTLWPANTWPSLTFPDPRQIRQQADTVTVCSCRGQSASGRPQ